jgi:hypothetical protein
VKIAGFVVIILGAWISLAQTTHARNVQLILPIAAALDAAAVPDRPTGAVKFFFADQPTPTMATKLETYVVSSALESKDAQETPNGSVKFFFGDQEFPAVSAKLGSHSTHQRSSTRPAEDARSCNVAFLKALMALQKRAQQAGANAVINITSYYRNTTFSSATEFECHAGVAAHVMLKGDMVKIAG